MFHHAPPDYDCPFCLLLNGVSDARVYSVADDVFYRDAAVTAFISSHQWPHNQGHVLVIPNRHYENIFDLPLYEAAEIHRVARDVAGAMKRAYGCAGISTRQHNEPAGNQDVWHYHLHVFPRYAGDNLYDCVPALMPPVERAQFAAQLRADLKAVADTKTQARRGTEPPRVYLEMPERSDIPELLHLHQNNRALHAPFSYPAQTEADLEAYLERCRGDDFQGFLVREAEGGNLVGVANLSQIFRGAFQNAFLGYYGSAPYAGQGLMTDGIRLILAHAFETLGLHRVEANVQPQNVASLRLLRRLGFRREGFSCRYLMVGGEWRDHERFAIYAEDWNETK